MTDDLTRPQEEAVRRLLAETRETGPMPADVAARLDAVIADLAHTRDAAPDEPATVVPLHRRRLPRLVLAAAAVTALGLGTVQVLDNAGQDTAPSDAGSAAESADQDASAPERDARQDRAAPPAPADERAVMADDGAGVEAPSSQARRNRGYDAAPVTLVGLDRALRAQGLEPLGRLHAVELHRSAATKQHEREADAFSATGRLPAGPQCGPRYDVVGGSSYTSATRPDTLVVAYPPVNGIRLVEVYDCAGGDPRRSAGVVTLTTEE